MDLAEAAEAKDEVRNRVWDLLRQERAARFPGAHGRIPNFVGAERAAERLAELPEWQDARIVKSNPDSPQWPVRTRAVAEGKLVYMAVPRLVEDRPFTLLDPARLPVAPRKASSIKGAGQYGTAAAIEEMPHVDLIVCGTVAVTRDGVRIGKGGGFSDLEFGLLTEAGLVDADTAIATTVHPLQVVDQPLPETEHDFRVDLVVTPDEVLPTRAPRRSPGILWSHLEEEKIARIPALQRLRG
ncbi:5-formyltetrahydrofolate cyclo-ligase [Allosalinactinospora lopnorensis]|uniref:5-formyltetrahydrofolate cyclo-ligase n=1 Tax=Allosalinactinospora lopnorensis TaxID=1352348 RepID=UPI000623DECD|nr:5-formyltetrahydrofolate cyclo-ligase [Allosalinactinospora lopnorensis]